MTIRVHLPTVALTLLAVLILAVLFDGPDARAADPERPVRCERYDVSMRDREDRETIAEKQRSQAESLLAALYSDGYTRVLWSDAYLTSFVAGEAHWVGFVCMAP